MSRIAVVPALLSILLAACTGGIDAAGVDTLQAAQVAQEVREGCVAENLSLFQDLADRIAPLALTTDLAELEALAAAAGCEFAPGVLTHYLHCASVPVHGGDVELHVMLSELDGILIAEIEAEGLYSRTVGVIEFDAASGLAVAGDLTTDYVDGCTVLAFLDDVQGQLVADLPDRPVGFLFTGGSVALHVLDGGAPYVSGTAALVGRRAVVVLEYGGVFAQGEIDLDR